MIDGRNIEGFDNAGSGQEDECHSVESTPGSGSPKASKYYPVWRDSQEFKQLVEGKHAGEAQAGAESNSDGDRFRAAATVALVMAALFVLIGVVLWYIASTLIPGSQPPIWLKSIALVLSFIAACVLLALGFCYAAARRAFYDRVRSIKAQRVDAEVGRLRKQDHLNLPNLFALNRRQLDEYHIVSVRQQAVAFRNAQIASAIGFIVLLTGVIITMNQAEDAERWVTAGLAGLGAAPPSARQCGATR